MTTALTVTRTEWVTPTVKRIHLRSDDLSAFAGSRFTDRYVKLVFPKAGVDYPDPIDVRALRNVMPPEDLPTVRTYTALFPDFDAGTLAIDFVIHGDEGVAGPWAAAAQPGDTLLANGPGGAYSPDPSADWHLLVGDESALPAIMAALAALDRSATARIVLEVERPGDEPTLDLTADAVVVYVYRSVTSDPDALLTALKRMEWPSGKVHAFVHGEAQVVMHHIRPYLFGVRELERKQVSISGYWRRGRTEESFRQWKSELARAEDNAQRLPRRSR